MSSGADVQRSDYAVDFHAWTQDQAAQLRGRDLQALDWSNLAEEIESLGASERREIRNRMAVLIAHLLKWEHQPERRSQSWQTTIGEQRTHVEGIVEDSPSLRGHPNAVLERAWTAGRRQAAREIRRDERDLPAEPTYTVEQILDHAFMPGEPWIPTDLDRTPPSG